MKPLSIIIAVLISFAFLMGCEKQGAVKPADEKIENGAVPGDQAPSVEQDAQANDGVEENGDEKTYWETVTRMYEHAKQSGATTAKSAGEWITEMFGEAKQMGGAAAGASSRWVTDLYEEAKRRGDTTASSAKEWVMDDIQKIGAWEYRTLEMSNASPADVARELNKLGQERWECFWVDKHGEQSIFYLKKSGRSYLRNLPARELLRFLPLGLGGGGDSEP